MNTRSFACVVCVGAIAWGLTPAGCTKTPEKQSAVQATPPEQIYSVRGRIAALPTADKPGSSLQIEHEPIDNFVRQDGKLGMDAMTMPFPLAKGVSLEGLNKGDIVEFTFEVRWKSQPRMQLTKIGKAATGTEVRTGKANPGK